MKSFKELSYYHDLIVNGDRKLIAWGAGNFFRSFYTQNPLPLTYVIDADPRKKKICGVSVRPPEALIGEDPQKTLVLIYSIFAKEIFAKIRTLGSFDCVQVSEVLGYRERARIEQRLKANDFLQSKPAATQKRAFMVQGPLIDGVTDRIVRYLTNRYPETYLCVSTWENTPQRLLKSIKPFVDTLVMSERPFAGYQNRNLQIVSTTQGLKQLKSDGIEVAFKLRSDIVPLADSPFETCRDLQAQYAPPKALGARLVIPELYTRKYLFYHPSDIAMFGRVDDLLTFWDVPLDTRRLSFKMFEDPKLSLEAIGRQQTPTETYLGCEFAKKIDWPLAFTLQDNWAFFRDNFIVVSPKALDLGWFKYPLLPKTKGPYRYQACISHAFWKKLQNGHMPDADSALTFRDYSSI
ncbi:MAG: hypothetical protein A2Y14_04840 [Verrucomicrobia bacterium GWF2_51_19]|nr:MAG: hypothetical protein A2Y14_04840 [Verrucomicrobia bacterium GWF2_51_19]